MTNDLAAVMAWQRGFTRGVTNNPPDDGPDLPFDPEQIGAYSDGQKLGRTLRTEGTDRSGTLVVKNYPEGTKVTAVPDYVGAPEPKDVRPLGVVPLRCAVETGRWLRVFFCAPGAEPQVFIPVLAEPNSTVTIDGGTLSSEYGTGPFKPGAKG